MIFDAFFAHFWDDFYMFFAYLFQQCFCLLFPRTFFKCMHTFKTRDLQKTQFFSSKNAIFEDPPLQKNFEKNDFGGGIVPCFWLEFMVFQHVFRRSFSHRFLDAFFDQQQIKNEPKT